MSERYKNTGMDLFNCYVQMFSFICLVLIQLKYVIERELVAFVTKL